VQYRIRRFGIQSTALTIGILYFVIALIIAPLLYLAQGNAPQGESLPGIAFVIGPFFYAIIGYLGTALMCWLYNKISGWSGGVSLTLEPDGAGTDTA
jgi:hypothetical protein